MPGSGKPAPRKPELARVSTTRTGCGRSVTWGLAALREYATTTDRASAGIVSALAVDVLESSPVPVQPRTCSPGAGLAARVIC